MGLFGSRCGDLDECSVTRRAGMAMSDVNIRQDVALGDIDFHDQVNDVPHLLLLGPDALPLVKLYSIDYTIHR